MTRVMLDYLFLAMIKTSYGAMLMLPVTVSSVSTFVHVCAVSVETADAE